jgi:hypothetical protein
VGKASVLAASDTEAPLVVLTTELPAQSSPGARALAAVWGAGTGKTICDVVDLLDETAVKRLRAHAEGLSDSPDV